MRFLFPICPFSICLSFICLMSASLSAEELFEPQQDAIPIPPPEGAIVLYDGEDSNMFLSKKGEKINWPIEEGLLISTPGGTRSNHIVSQVHFRDADIHVEFAVNEKGAGNSGIYIHGNYELQIIHSFGKKKLSREDIGAIYGFHKPLVNAARDRGEWQVYDIRYRAPRRDENGQIVKEGSITAWLNGQKVQDNARFGKPRSVYHPYRYNTTPYLKKIWERQKKTGVGPVFLQDHGNPVKFRNIWIRPLDDKAFVYNPDEEKPTDRNSGETKPVRKDNQKMSADKNKLKKNKPKKDNKPKDQATDEPDAKPQL